MAFQSQHSALRSAAEANPSAIADRYAVEALLGRGGMGAVYRVRDERTQRSLALKLIAHGSSASSAGYLEMFAREYRTLAQIAHPSVISVFEYGVVEQGSYYTMELLEGSDLYALAPLPFREACAYLRDVSSCLALLHSRRLLHRDVSPRNVRCSDGRAKLIDFGAMTPMGPARQVVGTPPLVPPEALQREPLDGRCDLYSLGATLYWALTRRHAYPARTLAELPQLWLQRPPPPSAFAPDVPEALDTLVMSLLAREAEARPRSAAEVMERLSAIAGLDADEHLRVPLAYLTTPALQGREAELSQVRTALESARKGKSRVLFVEGDAGVGRSRMLDSAVVEARLSGAMVLKLEATDAAHGQHVLARTLLGRAVELLPRASHSRELDELAVQSDGPEVDAAVRARLLSRARAIVRRVCAQMPVVIAVDDVELADEASQDLLAMLPRAARRRLVLLLGRRTDGALSPMLANARRSSDVIALSRLEPPQTEALLRSVFGDVPSVSAISARVHEVSGGNPRASMELAQHLLATGKARYEMGGWVLPSALERGDLPDAWSAVLDARLSALAPDERELAEVIAHSRSRALKTTEIDALTSHGSAERRAAALDGLLAAGLLQIDVDSVAFVSVAHRERVMALTPASRMRALHARLAARIRELGHDPILVARSEQLAGHDPVAIDTLLSMLRQGTRWETAPPEYAAVLERAIEACDLLGRTRRDRFVLLAELVRVGEHLGVANMRKHFAELFSVLRVEGALSDYEALPDTLEPTERLQRAFVAAQARYDARPEHERVFSPIEGVTALAMAVRQAAAFAAVSMDYELLQSLPQLAPFAVLSPALESTVRDTIPASIHLTATRYEDARRGYRATLDVLRRPDRAGLPLDFWQWASSALCFALGHIAAGLGVDEALAYADELAEQPAWLPAAWDVRGAYHRRQGDWREAQACAERVERILLETGRKPPMVDTSPRLYFETAAHAGDLISARHAFEQMQPLIELHPGYAVYAHYGPAVIELLRGNLELSLEHSERALAMARPGEHPAWPWITSSKLEALLALGRFEAARVQGRQAVEQARAIGLGVMADHLAGPLAIAEARLGEHDRAAARLDEVIAQRRALGSRGLNLGWAYEQRARVALWMGDRAAFAEAAEGCAREYGKGRGVAAFAAKYEALCDEARHLGIGSPSELPPQTTDSGAQSSSSSEAASFGSGTFEARCAEALALLVRESGAEAGTLYLCTDHGELVRCASTDGGDVPAEEQARAANVLDGRVDDEATVAVSSVELTEQAGVRWLPVAIGSYRGGRFRRTGVALLRFSAEPRPLSMEVIELTGRLLRSANLTTIA